MAVAGEPALFHSLRDARGANDVRLVVVGVKPQLTVCPNGLTPHPLHYTFILVSNTTNLKVKRKTLLLGEGIR